MTTPDNNQVPDDQAPAAEQTPTPQAEPARKPRKLRRNLIIGALAVIVLALVGWDIYAGVSHDSSGGPGTVDTDSSGTRSTSTSPATAGKVSQKDRDVAVRYEKLVSATAVKGSVFCPLVVNESHCKSIASNLGGGGLSGAVTVNSTVLLPASAGPSAAPSGAIGGTSPKLPETAVVLLDLHGTSANQPHQTAVLVRTSDHRVMAEELIGKPQERYTLAQLGQRIRAGAEDDASDWRVTS